MACPGEPMPPMSRMLRAATRVGSSVLLVMTGAAVGPLKYIVGTRVEASALDQSALAKTGTRSG